MTRRGIDYAWGRPSIQSIRGAGADFACRYFSWLPNGKCLTRDEADNLRGNGVDVVSNWEYFGDWAHDYSGGFSHGQIHAREAAKQHVDCGGPADRPIYFSVDWDVTEAQRATVADYYRGVASVIGPQRTGAYGGYWIIKYLFDVGVIRWGWQTYAWSGGNWDGRAQLRQVKNGVSIGGVDCDLNDAMTADFGQWGADDAVALEEEVPKTGGRTLGTCISDVWNGWVNGKSGFNGDVHHLNQELDSLTNDNQWLRSQLTQFMAAEEARDAAFSTAIKALNDALMAGGGNVDSAAIIASIRDVANGAKSSTDALLTELASLREREADMSRRLAEAYAAQNGRDSE